MRRLARLSFIFFTAWRYGLLPLLRDILKPGIRRGVLSIICWTSPSESLPRGERIRLTLEALGPIFVKFGQVLSTRRDLLSEDIANELGITLTAYQEMLSKSRGTQLLYLEELTGQADGDEDFLDRFIGDSESDPLHLLENQKMRKALIDAIELLPEREQSIMSMYYEQEMNLKEMAAVLGITDSRVSQLHSQAIARLRQKMKSS